MMDRKWIHGLPAIAAALCLNLVVFPLTLPRPAVAKDLVPPPPVLPRLPAAQIRSSSAAVTWLSSAVAMTATPMVMPKPMGKSPPTAG